MKWELICDLIHTMQPRIVHANAHTLYLSDDKL